MILFRISIFVCIVVCVFALNSCVTDKHIFNAAVGKDGNPVWVLTGSQTISDNNKRIFLGVGKVTLSGDLSKQFGKSDARAKAEIYKQLSSFIKVVSRNYIASGRAQVSGFDHFQASQHIATISEYNVPSVKVIAHWQDDKNNTVYSMAELDLSTVKTTLKPGPINNGFISYFNLEGNNIFDGLASKR